MAYNGESLVLLGVSEKSSSNLCHPLSDDLHTSYNHASYSQHTLPSILSDPESYGVLAHLERQPLPAKWRWDAAKYRRFVLNPSQLERQVLILRRQMPKYTSTRKFQTTIYL